MAPTDNKKKNKNFTKKDDSLRNTRNLPSGVKKKRKWVPEHKLFQGSVKEGQGFAFQRKERVRHEYNKLMRKERKRKPESKVMYKEEYPEHLKHLYMAEAEKLNKEAWENRVNRSKLRMKGLQKDDEDEDEGAADEDGAGGSELADSASGFPEPSSTPEKESLPLSNRMKKKMQRKTSYQKTKEEYENIREKRRKKKEEYLKKQQQREEAIQKYKQKKMETFQMLSKKTKKGQPNLNLQMEYLLQKIQGTNK